MGQENSFLFWQQPRTIAITKTPCSPTVTAVSLCLEFNKSNVNFHFAGSTATPYIVVRSVQKGQGTSRVDDYWNYTPIA
jgi:hypothetical protein